MPVCGDVDRQLTLPVIAESHVFLRIMLFDGHSISFRETFPFGVPVIATDCAAHPAGVSLILPRDLAALDIKIKEQLAVVSERVVDALDDRRSKSLQRDAQRELSLSTLWILTDFYANAGSTLRIQT